MYLDDVYDYLIAQGVAGGTSGFGCSIGYFSDDQDLMIGIFAVAGYPQDTLGRENIRPNFQTRVRGGELDYATVFAKWQEIFETLQDAQDMPGSPHLLPDVVYIQAMASAPAVFNDARRRPNMTSTWRMMRAR